MTKNISKTKHVDDLRKQAEKRIPKPADSISEISEIELKKLIHELEVHQIELEMQNEALRKSQMEAAESQNKYSDLYDFAPVGYFTFNKKGRIIEGNVTGAFLLGAEKRSLANQPFQRFIAHEHLSIFQSHLQKAHELRSKQTCKLKLTGKDGSLFDALIDTIVVIDGEGKFDHYRSAVTDITEIARAEEALREAEEGYRALASTVDSMYLVDRECRYQFINDAHLLRLGVSLDQVKGRSYGDFHSEEDLKQFAATIEAVFETRKSFQIEHKGRIGDSFFLRTFSPVRSPQGSITAVTVISKDITERKRAEEALRISLIKYQTLFHTLPIGVTISDKAGKIIDSNMEAERLLGLQLEEHVKRTIDGQEWSIIRPDGSPMLAAEYASVRAMKENRLIENVEMGIIKGEGDVTWINVTAAPIPLKDYGVVIAYSDIAERKKAQDALAKSQGLLREAQRVTHMGHWELDTSTMTPAWSEEIFHIFGLDHEEGAPSFEAHQKVTHPDDWGILNNAVTTSIVEGIPFNIEFRILRPDKTIRWMHAIGYPKKDSEGRIVSVFGTAQDITDRKLTENALRNSEENFRRSMDDSPLGVRIVTVEGETIYANRVILDIYGYDSIEELRATPVVKRYTPESFAEFQTRKEKRKRGDYSPSEYDISIVRKDGEVRHLHVFRKEIHWDCERQFQVLYQDITERKRAELELQILLKSMINAFVVFDPVFDNAGNIISHRFAYINDTYERITGVKNEEVKGKTMHEVWPETEPEWIRRYGEVAVTGVPQEFELYHDPTKKLYHCSVYRPWETKGRFCVVFEDITERKQTEDALKNRAEFITTLLNTIPSPVFYKDVSGRYLGCNRAFEELLGVARDNIIGKSVYDVSSAEIAEKYEVMDKELFEKGGHQTYEWVVRAAHGSEKDVIYNKATFPDARGNIAGIVGVMTDITERKRAEEAIKASHQNLRVLAGRLQSIREDERKQIAREIHDELGGALTGLKIDLSFLTRSAPNNRDKTKRDSFLSKIREMTKLIDETIGMVRRVVTELRPSILDDFGLLEALEWQLQEFEKKTGVKCKFVSSMVYVSLDEERSTAVFRIFQESLTNVARHANATKVTATLYKEADSLVLKVEDNGKGISEDDIHNVKSIGLIGICERALFLRGTVNFSGEPSKGTTVSLQFPFES